MLLPLSLHKYHTWAAPDAVELQLQVLSKKLDFIQQEVHVLPANLRADDHLAEEVDFAPVRLVPKHHAALLHHSLFNYRSNLKVETKKRFDVTLRNTAISGRKYILWLKKFFWTVWVLHSWPVFPTACPKESQAQTSRFKALRTLCSVVPERIGEMSKPWCLRHLSVTWESLG